MTFKELKKLDTIVGQLYSKDETLRETKFCYAYKRFYEKNYAPTQEEFSDKVKMAWIDNALEGKDKEILKDPTDSRGFKFSKEGLKKVIEEEKKLIKEYDEKEVEIIPHVPAYIPDLEGLDEEELELLKNFTEKDNKTKFNEPVG